MTAADHVAELKAVLGTDKFPAVYERLKNLPREEIVIIADRFNGPVPPSASKTRALQAIYSRNRKLVTWI